MNIGMGTRMQLHLKEETLEIKAVCDLAGMIPHEFLIVRVPPVPGISTRLLEGESVVVRYIYEGKVYGFKSSLLTLIHKPALIAFLSYPPAVEIVNLRKVRRVECRLSATITSEGCNYKAVMTDISYQGCRIFIEYGPDGPLSFDVGQSVGLSFHLPGTPGGQVVNGAIRNLKKDVQHCEMGLQFIEADEAAQEDVRIYIGSLPPELIA